MTIRDKGSTFSHNSARGDGAYGGAVSMASSYISSTWTRTRFIGNSAGTNSSGNEGYGGAFYSSNESGDAFTQVTMSGNEAAYEGGAYYGDNDAYEATFRSSTISDNTAGTSSLAGDGGGIYADDTVLVVQNSTLTGNKATSVSGDAGQGGDLCRWLEVGPSVQHGVGQRRQAGRRCLLEHLRQRARLDPVEEQDVEFGV